MAKSTTILQNGNIIAIIIASDEVAAALYPDCEIRDTQPGDALSVVVEPPPPAEPLSVTAYQLRRALTQSNLRTAVEAAIAAAPQSVKDEWQFKQTYRRDHPTVAMIAAAIGKTPQDIDAVFALAKTFE